MIDAFPLHWPPGHQRHSAHRDGRFSSKHRALTIAEALKRVQDELDRIGARYPVMSSNLELRQDGRPAQQSD